MQWSSRVLLTLALAAIPFQWYVLRTISNALGTALGLSRKRLRVGIATAVAWLSLYPLAVISSETFRLDQVAQALQKSELLTDILITYPFWIGLILVLQLTILFLPIHLVWIALLPLTKNNNARWVKVRSALVLVVLFVTAVYVILRVYNDTFTIRTRETSFEVSGLPQELEGFRIVEIADIQVDSRTNGDKLEKYLRIVNGLDPDLIVFGGDLVTSGVSYIDQGAALMGRMRARRGVYASLGDHDHFSDRSMVINALQRNGVTVLDNVATVVPVGATYLSLTGITNVYRTRPSDRILNTIEQQRLRGPVNILLTHQPSRWLVRFAAEHGYDLFLAGHTHGGQIGFPLPGFFLAGSSFETDYVSGFYSIGSLFVSINNGLGFTLAPIRYHAPAEVTLIVLRSTR